MNRLKSKLERRRQKKEEERQEPITRSKEGPSSELLNRLKKRMEKVAVKHAPSSSWNTSSPAMPRILARDLPGEVAEIEEGTVLVRQKIYPQSYSHGHFLSSDFLQTGTGLAALANEVKIADFSPLEALFLDTETTGLAGGTGTLAFLVGIGWLEDDGRFVVEQLFCREPAEERAQLKLLARRVGMASFFVTFNGRAFDIPLLNTRFVLNQMKNPGYALPHLDLLSIARRIFKRRLADCSLGNLESAILGFERVGDIPGHAIPGAYAAFLRGGPVEPMEAVLEHNALDLVGLAALGALLEKLYNNPSQVEHAADALGLAKAALIAGEQDIANGHLSRASLSAVKDESRDAYVIAARAASKQGEFDEAKAQWYKALEQSPDVASIHLALAKLLEHRDKDFLKALDHAAMTSGAEGEEGSEHRIARLKRRLAKKG